MWFNNEITLKIDTPGSHKLYIDSLNICGQSFGQKNITVRDAPDVELGNDTILCLGETIDFYGTGTGNSIAWHPPSEVDDQCCCVNPVTLQIHILLNFPTLPLLIQELIFCWGMGF